MLKMEDELKIQHEKRNESKYIRNYERNGRTVCTNGRRVCTVRHTTHFHFFFFFIYLK
jgi:uncharacterized protein YkuJ